MLMNDIKYFVKKANLHCTTYGMDHPDKSARTTEEWYRFPVQNFDYKYNNWGFRGPNYEQYIGKPVNLCIGDSYTENTGGPIEHSWPSQLAQKFDIPTLNLGVAGAGNDTMRIIYERACKLFDVQNTFVIYSLFYRRLIDGRFLPEINKEQIHNLSDEENFEYFFIQRLPQKPNVYECGIPEWDLTPTERKFLSDLGIYFLDELYFSNFQTIDRKFINGDAYNSLRGEEWPTLEQFVQGADPHPDMLTKEYGKFISNVILGNRDGYHMNQLSNKLYADYFYNKWKQNNES